MRQFSITLELNTDKLHTITATNAEDGEIVLYIKRHSPPGDFPVTLTRRDALALMDMLYTMEQYSKN